MALGVVIAPSVVLCLPLLWRLALGRGRSIVLASSVATIVGVTWIGVGLPGNYVTAKGAFPGLTRGTDPVVLPPLAVGALEVIQVLTVVLVGCLCLAWVAAPGLARLVADCDEPEPGRRTVPAFRRSLGGGVDRSGYIHRWPGA